MKKDRWQEISKLYNEALELPEEKQEAFLDAFADNDLKREVRSLLENQANVNSLFQDSALGVAAVITAENQNSLVGKKIKSYHLRSELGKGGMGEVYLARDESLDREVAIKVLPEEFARDSERIARFQREAKLLASLNHPNIAAIHGLEKSGATGFLVLELVEGETLADRLKRGPIPVEEALGLAMQIIDALEAAHEKRVIHRDLKPTNIKVTPDGMVKILDFGLAKTLPEESPANPPESLSGSVPESQPGLILGTASYMAPEQARGNAVDRKADIWAFGCVLYEMLAGRPVFSGDSVSEILAAVIRAEPDWSRLPGNLHWRLREVIEYCLQKDPKDRYHDISDVRLDIQKALSSGDKELARSIEFAKRQWTRHWAIPSIVLVAIIMGIGVWQLKPTLELEPRPFVHYSQELPEDQQIDTNILQGTVLAVSREGRQFVYCANEGLYLGSLNELSARHIPGSNDDPRSPFFSFDGQWVGYYSRKDGNLKKIKVEGGTPHVICEDVNTAIYGAEWGKDNTIIYADGVHGIWSVSDNGGTAKLIIEGNLAFPQRIQDGKSVLFTDIAPLFPCKIMVESLVSRERKELLDGEWARYLPSGHLIYGNLFWSESKTYVVPFDSKTLKKGGAPLFLEEVASKTLPAFSNTGTLVYVPGGTTSDDFLKVLVWVDRNGNEIEVALDKPQNYWAHALSPDNKKLAVAIKKDMNVDIFIWDFENKSWKQLTEDKGTDGSPIWTPQSDRIVFRSTRNNEDGIYWMATDRIGGVEKLVSIVDHVLYPYGWADGGKALVFLARSKTGGEDIGILSIKDRKWTMLLQEEFYENSPHISPNGRFLAYASNESGQFEVYVRPYPDLGGLLSLISEDRGGQSPVWLRNGRELIYCNRDDFMVVDVNTDADFTQLGAPRVLFTKPYSGTWSISKDGNRFLLSKPYKTAKGSSFQEFPGKINIGFNFDEELKQKYPN